MIDMDQDSEESLTLIDETKGNETGRLVADGSPTFTS
jgi:hypothetical protein